MTVLRSLNIELGLTDNVSNRLLGIDNQINRLDSGVIDTQSGFDDLGRATTEYGRVAGNEIESIGKDVTELDKQVEQSADVTAEAAADMATSWGKVGAAIGAAAAATELYLRSQQDMYFTGAKIAYITGMDRREVTGLASDLTNLSFSLEDAYGVMEVGARQGLRTRSELEKYAQTWDAIATASGEDAATLAQAGIALRSVGVAAGEEEEALDALGFVMQKTQMDTSDFLRLTGYMARDMDLYEMSINDVAVTLAALEERGLGSREAQRELRSAMTNAKGDVTALYRELRITDEQLTRLNEEIDGGEEYIASMGEAFADAQTPLQWLQMQIGKTAHVLGNEFNPLLEVGSVAMTGVSSALLMGASAAYLYSVASTTSLIPSLAAATTSAWAFTASLLANPLTWVVVGIVALGAALYLLASNWDTVSGWFMDRWEQVSSVVTGAIDWISGAWDATVGSIIAGAEWLGDKLQYLMLLNPFTALIAGMHLLRDNWDTVVGAIGAGWDWLVGAAQDGAAWLGETIDAGLSGIVDLFWQYHPIGIVIRQWDEITSYLQGIDLFETGKNILLGLVSGILDIRQQAIDAVMGIGEDILNAVTGFFGISSPSKLMQEMGHRVGEGFALGVGESMPDSIPLPGFLAGPQPAPGVYETAAPASVNSPLVGEIQYTAVVEEPAVSSTLTGEVGYHNVFEPPNAEALHRQVLYSPALDEPAIEDLAGTVTYLSTVVEPIVPAISEEATYSTTVSEPVLSPLEGSAIWYSRVTEPAVSTPAGEAVYTSTLTEPDIRDLAGAVTYQASLEEPRIPTLTGEVRYLSVVTDPTVADLAGVATYQAYLDDIEPDTLHGKARYTSTLTEPVVADLAGEAVYSSALTEPVVGDLTGAITYLSTVIKPVVSALTGNLTYESRVSEPTIADRAGTVVYESEVSEPTIAALTGAITYVATVLGPAIPLLTGVVTYLSEVLAPEVPVIAGTIDYGATIPGPEVPTLTGDLVYEPEVSEPTISDLTGAITYLAKVVEPVISALTGDLIYETRVSEPTIIDRNGTVVYENEVSEPTISALTSAITYVASVLEPFIKPLMGYVQYEFKVTEPEISDFVADITYLSTVNEPNITALERNVLYRDQPPETPIPDGMTVKYDTEIIEPELAGLTGAITYLSEIIKPIVETLEGIIEYRGIITEPIIPEHISRGYDIPEKQIEFESPDQDAAVQRYDYRPENDTVSTPQSVYSTFAPSTTIHITASGNDAQTIATAVDRRLRQTFDQHAETYFARQIRRKGLGSNI